MLVPRILIPLLVLSASVSAQDRQATSDGLTPLFDGRSLQGWRMVNCRDNFLVQNGRLVMNKGAGWLATEKTYNDFELRVRYRFVTPGADSGIFIRADLEGTNWTNKGYQIQNMDNQTIGRIVGMGPDLRGKFQQSHQPDLAQKAKKPSGEWNELVIVARGPKVTVTLNGQVVATSEEITKPSGHIGLQAEGGVLEFERMDLKPLEASSGVR
jgi:hypothetical protein